MCVFWALNGVLGGCKVYTGSGRMSLYPVFDGSRYQHLCCSMLVRGYKRTREEGELTSLLCVGGPKTMDWSPPLSFGSGIQVFRSRRVCVVVFRRVSSLFPSSETRVRFVRDRPSPFIG
jgi:hypothetical protein